MTMSIRGELDLVGVYPKAVDPQVEKGRLLEQIIVDLQEISPEQLAGLYRLHPKVVGWSPKSELTLFSYACLYEDALLAMELIEACERKRVRGYLWKDLDTYVFKNLPTLFKGIAPFKNSLGWTLLSLAYYGKERAHAINKILTIYREHGQLANIFEKNEEGRSPFRKYLIDNGFCGYRTCASTLLKELLGSDDQLEITRQLYQDCQKHSELMQELLFSHLLSMDYLGSHFHTGGHFTKFLLDEERNAHIPKKSKLASALSEATAPAFQKSERIEFPITEEYFLGRTVVFLPKIEGELCDAYKFAKEGESEEFLGLESTVTAIFTDCMQLKSRMPEPQGCYSVSFLPEAMTKKLEGITKPFSDGNYRVYHYKAPIEYFKYLHDVVDADSDDSYRAALPVCIHDRVALVKEGVYPVTADIWHNIFKGYRFVSLSDYMAVTRGMNQGMGRISRGFTNVEWANERFSGGADWVDFTLLFKILGTKINDITKYHANRISSLQLNAISELYVTYSLIAVYRLYKRGEVDWQEKKCYTLMAQELKTVFVQIFASYTDENEAEVISFAEAGDIDWEMMAREISFWVDHSRETGYYDPVYEGKLPKELYPGIRTRVMTGSDYDRPEFKGEQFFRPGLGFCEDDVNIIHDFGPYGGPLGWATFERALYKFCIFTYNIAEYKAIKGNAL